MSVTECESAHRCQHFFHCTDTRSFCTLHIYLFMMNEKQDQFLFRSEIKANSLLFSHSNRFPESLLSSTWHHHASKLSLQEYKALVNILNVYKSYSDAVHMFTLSSS
ncbi:hypothetical protein VNO77_01893 [Canavalia gladiata]|uniref:Uncharacterized protein n=1 Tax=Canavalia gladiata TaxID=3824 RepID=A0AAN9MS21_CANGL